MMGTTDDNLDTPVTKTSTGVIILPRTHHTIEHKLKPGKHRPPSANPRATNAAIARNFPALLLGFASNRIKSCARWPLPARHGLYNQWAAMCCSCGLCTLYSCPEELFPKEACDDARSVMRAKQMKWTGPMNPKPHAMIDGRRVPIKTLAKKLHVLDYDLPAPLCNQEISSSRLILPLKQSAGTPCISKVKVGDRRGVLAKLSANPRRTRSARFCTRR